MRRLYWLVCHVLLPVLLACSQARADPATHALPDESRQRQVWAGDAQAPYIVRGCLPTVPAASATLGAVACEGYVPDLTTGERLYVAQEAAAVGPLVSGNGAYWLVLHRDRRSTLAGWSRQPGTHYLWQLSATRPAAPSGGLLVAAVDVAGGVITTVRGIGPLSPQGPGWVDVTSPQFGVRCDGVTDDTAALQRVLTQAPPGSTLRLPAGVCLVDSLSFVGTRGLTLEGAAALPTETTGFPGAGKTLGTKLRIRGAVAVGFQFDNARWITLRNLSFDGNFLATHVVDLSYLTGSVYRVLFEHVTVERAVLTTGTLVSTGLAVGAQNLEVDSITFRYFTIAQDLSDGTKLAGNCVELQQSNSTQLVFEHGTIRHCANEAVYLLNAQARFYKVQVEFYGVHGFFVGFAALVIDTCYTESTGATAFLAENDTAAGGNVVMRNTVVNGTNTPVIWRLQAPLLLEHNTFALVSATTTSTDPTQAKNGITAIDMTLAEVPDTPGIFNGPYASGVIEINTHYMFAGLPTVNATRFGETTIATLRAAGVSFGSTSQRLTYVRLATSVQSIAAPGVVPGCTESTAITLTGAAVQSVYGTVFLATLIDRVLPAGGQLSAHVTAANTVKVRWCQFEGAAVSPDLASTGTYTVQMLQMAP